MAALVRTDEERGPLVAAGLVALVVAALLLDTRFEDEWAASGRLVVTGLPALLALAIAYFAPKSEAPPAWLSAILVAEFAIVLTALGNLADVLGADGQLNSSGTVTWVGLVVTAMLVASSLRHNSAIMALLAGLAGTVTLLAFVDWAFGLENPLRTFRWLLMLAAIGLGAAGYSMRPTRPRHGVALVDAAALVVLALALTFAVEAFIGAFASAFGGGSGDGAAGWGWELFVLVAAAALVAYAVANKEPGPGYLGAFNLLAFILMAAESGDDPSVVGWPLWLLLIALALLAFALRPRPGAGAPAPAGEPPDAGAPPAATTPPPGAGPV